MFEICDKTGQFDSEVFHDHQKARDTAREWTQQGAEVCIRRMRLDVWVIDPVTKIANKADSQVKHTDIRRWADGWWKLDTKTAIVICPSRESNRIAALLKMLG